MAKRESNVLIVTGDDGYTRRRTVREIVAAKSAEGWRVERVDGAVEGQLETSLDSGSGMFLKSKSRMLTVVDNPDKVDPGVYKAHAEDADTTTVLLLQYDGVPAGNTKFGKYVATQKDNLKECKAPKDWDAPDIAAKFCVQEAKRYGLTMEMQMAGAIVERAGADLGILSFEILKLGMLSKADGFVVVTADSVSQSLAMLLEAEMQPVISAVSDRNLKRMCSALDRVHKTAKTDATVTVCRVLGATALKWIGVADLREKGKSPEEAATLLGLNPWYYRNKLLPQVNRWPRRDLVTLLRALTVSERNVLAGGIRPWTGLVGRLLYACRTA